MNTLVNCEVANNKWQKKKQRFEAYNYPILLIVLKLVPKTKQVYTNSHKRNSLRCNQDECIKWLRHFIEQSYQPDKQHVLINSLFLVKYFLTSRFIHAIGGFFRDIFGLY